MDYKDIELKYIRVDDLFLDKENPRLPKSFQKSATTEEDIIDYMLLEASTIELMLSIKSNGFFVGEQLLVVENDDKSTYTVVEGNRRLSAVKLLHNRLLATAKKNTLAVLMQEEGKEPPTELPCLVFPTRQDILKHVGFKHITGIQSWKLLEKARYVYEQKNIQFSNKSIDEAAVALAKIMGSKKNYIKRLIVGFEIYKIIEDEKFYNIPNLDDTGFHFNYISDSLRFNNISSNLGIDLSADNPIENLNINYIKDWTNIFFKPFNGNRPRLIGDSEHLSKYNKVLGDNKALKAFNNGVSIEQALDIAGETDDNFEDYIKEAIRYLGLSFEISLDVKKTYKGFYEDAKQINTLIREINRIRKDKDDDDEFGL